MVIFTHLNFRQRLMSDIGLERSIVRYIEEQETELETENG